MPWLPSAPAGQAILSNYKIVLRVTDVGNSSFIYLEIGQLRNVGMDGKKAHRRRDEVIVRLLVYTAKAHRRKRQALHQPQPVKQSYPKKHCVFRVTVIENIF